MSQPITSVDEHKRRLKALHDNKLNITKTAAALKIPRPTMNSWILNLRTLMEEWGNFAPSEIKELSWNETFFDWLREHNNEDGNPVVPATAKPDKDILQAERDKRVRLRLQRERDEAVRRATAAEDIRTSIFGLTAERLEPVSFQPEKNLGHSSAETVIVNLSDWQWGEVVDIAAMDGINSYSPQIAARRAERCFQAILDLMTKHWSGPPPARLILILGGDMVSGDIHLELTRTNALSAIPAVRDCVTYLRAGVSLLLDNLECPIDIISLPGNHGRSTLKNESKLLAETSYDTLVADFLEMEFRHESRITFYTPVSGDARFSVYGWHFLATHGHNIGARGGMGFVGPAATAARGFKRLIADYAGRGVHIDVIIIGHFHTALALEEGFVNSSLVGPSEYSRDGRFRPRPATQLFLAVHPRRGVSQYRFINVGSPEEGSLYERPPLPADPVRPRYRVPAAGQTFTKRLPEQFDRGASLGKFKA